MYCTITEFPTLDIYLHGTIIKCTNLYDDSSLTNNVDLSMPINDINDNDNSTPLTDDGVTSLTW